MLSKALLLGSLIATAQPAFAAAKASCVLERIEKEKGEPSLVRAAVLLKDDEFVTSDGLEFRGGNYNFVLSYASGQLDITFQENNHVQDEVGSLSCDTEGVRRNEKFCEEPISARDFNTDEDDVSAFNFWCVLK